MSNPNQSPKPTFTNEEFQDYSNSSFDGYVGHNSEYQNIVPNDNVPFTEQTIAAQGLRRIEKQLKPDPENPRPKFGYPVRTGVAVSETIKDNQGNKAVYVKWDNFPAGGVYLQRLGEVGLFDTNFAKEEK